MAVRKLRAIVIVLNFIIHMPERFRPPVVESPVNQESTEKPELPPQDGLLTTLNKKIRREFVAIGVALSLSADSPAEARVQPRPRASANESIKLPRELPHTYFDENPDYFKTFTKNGEFSELERQKRTNRLKNGAVIFKDVGLSFYQVQKGDNISEIRRNLLELPQYAYIKDQKVKLESFNIPAKELRLGMWLPIPLENEDRHVTDEQFARYATLAVREMRKNPDYGEYLNKILQEITERELIATMVAVAKQESGGKPIGQFELHRWERAYRAFSFSIFHILMEKYRGVEGPGLEARKKLNLTEGQVYHPQNAVKLFIGYLKEKGAKPEQYFPVVKHAASFASMYNGRGWRKKNPRYVKNVTSYYQKALGMLDSIEESGDTEELVVEAVEAEQAVRPVAYQRRAAAEQVGSAIRKKEQGTAVFTVWERVGHDNMTSVVENAHFRYNQKTKKRIFGTDRELRNEVKKIMRYLQKRFGTDTYYPGDTIGIGIDARGGFFKFRGIRNGKSFEELIRIK